MSIESPETIASPEREVEGIEKFIERIMKNPISLGIGKSAEVFSSAELGICIKRSKEEVALKDLPINTIDREMDFQQRARELMVRAPLPIKTLETEQGSFLLMERIRGVSIEDVLKGREPLPAAYNHEEFWQSAERMINRLHEGAIYHRDLHAGNLMIEEETGDPVMIDFGHAGIHFAEEDDPYRKKDWPIPGHDTDLIRDDEQCRDLKGQLKEYLTKVNN